MAQPPLSNQIKQLEEELGVRLFERSSRGVHTTDAGELLLEEARRVFALVEGTVNMVQRVGHGEVGRLTLGFVPSASDELLPPILSSFGERYPDVDLFLREMRPDLIVQRLHEGQIDAGFLYLPLDDASLDVECVSREPLVLALPAKHSLSSEEQVDLASLADEPFILPARYRRMPGLYGQVTEACRQAGFTPNAVQKDVWLMQTIVGLVAGGIGVALVPASSRTSAARASSTRRCPASPPLWSSAWSGAPTIGARSCDPSSRWRGTPRKKGLEIRPRQPDTTEESQAVSGERPAQAPSRAESARSHQPRTSTLTFIASQSSGPYQPTLSSENSSRISVRPVGRAK